MCKLPRCWNGETAMRVLLFVVFEYDERKERWERTVASDPLLFYPGFITPPEVL